MSETILVTGAGGFVGGKLVKHLVRQGHDVRAVSSRPVHEWLTRLEGVENVQADLRDINQCRAAVKDVKWIYNLAAKVGGIGYIGGHQVDCFLSVLINTNLLHAACNQPLAGYLFASSACVYGSSERPIKEDDLLVPSPGYGEEKVFSEKVCAAFFAEFKIPVQIVRFTGIYGPGDDHKGATGKDHVPSAICRKVIAAKRSGKHEINIWGDGEQTRDFLFVDDAVEGMYRLQTGGHLGTVLVNMGGSEKVSVNQIVSITEEFAAVKLERFYNLSAPCGVRHRQLDNSALWELLRWEPPTKFVDGLSALYRDLWEQSL